MSPLHLGGYLPGPLSTSSIKGKRAGISVFLFFLFAFSFSFSLRCVPPSPQKRKPVRVFQVFTEWERWSRWTRRDTQGGSLVCSHCIISVHNKHIISRWTTPLPSHLGWELDCNKQPSPLYRSSTSNDALIETQTVYCAVFDGSTEWLSSRNSPQRLFFLLCNGYSLHLINFLSPTLCFGSCSCTANRHFPSNITNHERTHIPRGTVDSMALSRVHVFFLATIPGDQMSYSIHCYLINEKSASAKCDFYSKGMKTGTHGKHINSNNPLQSYTFYLFLMHEEQTDCG